MFTMALFPDVKVYIVDVECTCCTLYKEWTIKHSSLAKKLHTTSYYTLFPNEEVNVVLDGIHLMFNMSINSCITGSMHR